MDTSGSKMNSRCANFTYEEEQLLIKLVEKYKNIVECKKSNSVTWKEKERGWHSIESEFNSSSGKCFRSVKNLKEKYNNIKKKTKQKWAQEKKMVLKTGGGCYSLPNESNVDNVMKDILGEQLTGLANNYDDDRSFTAEYPTDLIVVTEEVVDDSACDDHSYLKDNLVLKELDNNCGSANSKSSVDVTNNNCSSIADIEPPTQEHDWSTYTRKNLKKPASYKLRSSEPNVRKIRTHSITKKIMNPSNVLIEEKLEFVRLQKEKFLEEHNLRMDLLKKKINLIDRKLDNENQN